MEFNKIHNVYFLGIGGIGMSALARYFHQLGKEVAGYDRTPTPLTQELTGLGMNVHFEDDEHLIPKAFLNKETTLVVRTPAVPANHEELNYFQNNNFTVLKRARVLGLIFNHKQGIAVAGTHGKTSVSTFASFLLKAGGIDISAFLGGISKNFNSNLILGNSEYVVAEADEFDRSFLQLSPQIALVTTVDADHLDIYSDYNDISNTFGEFLSKTADTGTIILNQSIELKLQTKASVIRYSLKDPESDFYATNLLVKNGAYHFTLNTPNGKFPDYRIEVPGKINLENAIGAMAICITLGIGEQKLQEQLPKMKGVVRRFDLKVKNKKTIYFDDYAHHPSELEAAIGSIRELYPEKEITGVFQPHLYTRTRDFVDGFVEALSKLDRLILLDIYPAREEPIPGVSSKVLYDRVSLTKKHYCSKENLLDTIKGLNIELLITLGAGDIDQFVEPLTQQFKQFEEV